MSLRLRRGSVSVPEEVPPEDFGPVLGRDWVIATAGPRPEGVSDPGGGVSFSTWQGLTDAITAEGVNTTFVKRGGAATLLPTTTYNVGSKFPRIWFPGLADETSPTCAVINGGGNQISGLVGGAMEIHGGAWTNFGNQIVTGGRFPFRLEGVGALAEDFVCYDNVDAGFTINATGTARYAGVTRNGQNGFTLNGVHNGTLVEHIHVWDNNVGNYNPGDSAAGMKAVVVTGAGNVMRYIYCHDNNAWGLWQDDTMGIRFEECVSEDNARSGFFFEIGQGGAALYRCMAKNNGRNIVIGPDPVKGTSSSPTYLNCVNVRVADVDSEEGSGIRGVVERSIFDHTTLGSAILGGLLVFHNHDHGANPRRISDWDITDNLFIVRPINDFANRVGGQDAATSGTILWDASVVWDRNIYRVDESTGLYWRWGTAGSASRTETDIDWTAWQAKGQDPNSTRELI